MLTSEQIIELFDSDAVDGRSNELIISFARAIESAATKAALERAEIAIWNERQKIQATDSYHRGEYAALARAELIICKMIDQPDTRADELAELRRDAVFDYDNQPDNIVAWRIGEACSKAKPGGDYIDHGLSLLKELQAKGYGITAIAAQKEQK